VLAIGAEGDQAVVHTRDDLVVLVQLVTVTPSGVSS
jgi:hypothetical protein